MKKHIKKSKCSLICRNVTTIIPTQQLEKENMPQTTIDGFFTVIKYMSNKLPKRSLY